MKKNHTKLFSLFFLFSTFGLAQTSGIVKDAMGFPESDIEVKIKGTDTSVYTDIDGNFEIDASIGDTLIIKDKEIKVTSANLGDLGEYFKDEEAIIDLKDAVIVTGYSTQRKEEVTASVSVVDSKQLLDTKSPNITNLLQGKVAGLNITNGSGRPGELAAIRLRGRTSIYGNLDALWVVDGVIYHKTPNINPNDVETVSILKDAAATSQYGSRGANGVVIVTTKRGRGTGLTVNADYSSSFNQFNSGKFEVMSANELFTYFNGLTGVPANQLPPASVLENSFDWVDNGIKTGLTYDANVSINSNTEKSNLFTSLGYYKEEGSVKGYEYDRIALRMNLDQKLSERLSFKPKLNATFTTKDNREHSLYQMYMNMPWDNPFDANGKAVNPREVEKWYGRDYANYYYDLETNYGQNENLDAQLSLDWSWKISNTLTFESTNNLQYYSTTAKSYVDPNSISGSAYGGQVYQYSDRRIVKLFNQMLRYQNKFGLHSLGGYAAYEYSDYDYTHLSGTTRGIVAGSEILDNGANPFDNEGTRNDYAFQAVLAQANYGYDNRYHAQASYRLDGSSRFGKNNRYAHFYAFSAGWNINNEAFLRDSKAISNLKLRASFGVVGNVGENYYMQYGLYSLTGQYDENPALTQGQYKNPDVSWEQSEDLNVGLELGLYNRVNMSLDLYNKNTNKLLHFVRFPDTSGWTGYWDNVGKINNKGIEFAMNANVFAPSSEFQWNVSFNIASNKNEVIDLYDDAPIFMDPITGGYLKRIEEGRDIDSWYMRKWAGVDPTNGKPQWEIVDPTTGEVTLTNNYNNATSQYVGEATPDFSGGFATSMSYKGLTLSADFVFSKGGYAYNVARELFDSDGAYPYYNQMSLQDGWSRWTPENTNATHPEAIYNNTSAANKTSSRYLEDASFLKMRQLRLGYNFDSNLIQTTGLKGLGIYIAADNIWTITNYSGVDVESAISGDRTSSSNDRTSNYPNPKRITLGVNLTF